jgi:hypothetical protein
VLVDVGRPQHFPLRDFLLCRDGNLRRPLDTRCAPARQLRGAKAGQDRELERTDGGWTSDHWSLSVALATLALGKALVRALAGMAEGSEKREVSIRPMRDIP